MMCSEYRGVLGDVGVPRVPGICEGRACPGRSDGHLGHRPASHPGPHLVADQTGGELTVIESPSGAQGTGSIDPATRTFSVWLDGECGGSAYWGNVSYDDLLVVGTVESRRIRPAPRMRPSAVRVYRHAAVRQRHAGPRRGLRRLQCVAGRLLLLHVSVRGGRRRVRPRRSHLRWRGRATASARVTSPHRWPRRRTQCRRTFFACDATEVCDARHVVRVPCRPMANGGYALRLAGQARATSPSIAPGPARSLSGAGERARQRRRRAGRSLRPLSHRRAVDLHEADSREVRRCARKRQAHREHHHRAVRPDRPCCIRTVHRGRQPRKWRRDRPALIAPGRLQIR